MSTILWGDWLGNLIRRRLLVRRGLVSTGRQLEMTKPPDGGRAINHMIGKGARRSLPTRMGRRRRSAMADAGALVVMSLKSKVSKWRTTEQWDVARLGHTATYLGGRLRLRCW